MNLFNIFRRRKNENMIYLKSDAEIDDMKESCKLAAATLNFIEDHIKPGISTLELNDLCHKYILDHKAIPAPLNYKGFPKSICTSVNNVVCHGIPKSSEVLKKGDIINVDITTILDGYHGDTSRTFIVGETSEKTQLLVERTQKAMMLGIEAVKIGGRIGDIGAAIQNYAESFGYGVVKDFVGHGIGKNFHEKPQIPHYGKKGTLGRFKPGMVFTIEPMINEGDWRTEILDDDWTAITIDDSLSAQFEHTIAIRSNGEVEILTLV